MIFCPACGARVSLEIPPGDNRRRHVCRSCGSIHYQNPKVVVGCLPEWKGKLLLCRRAIEPRHGFWTLPAGFLENGETMEQGAVREAREEANANLEVHGLYTIFSIPHIGQVYAFYRARLLDRDFHAGDESLDVRLFDEAEIPWDELAFPVVHKTLELWGEDRRTGGFRTHAGDVIRCPEGGRWPRFTIRSA